MLAVIERRGQILRTSILQCFVQPVQVSLEKLNVYYFQETHKYHLNLKID